jgi:tetratricopeptide (TPR) repeat protein
MRAQDKNFLNELTLYTEFFKQEDYKSGRPHWDKLYSQYPASTLNLYIHGSQMFEKMLQNAQSDEERDKILNEYMKLYDKRIKHFGEKGYVLGRKGTTWFKYKLYERDNAPEAEELISVHKTGYEYLSESVQERGNETEPPVLVLLMQSSVALFKLGELPKEQVVKNYEKIMEIANAIIEANEDERKVAQTRDQVIPSVEKIFGVSGAADCEALVNIYTPQFQEKGNDIDFIKSMLTRLGRAKCTDSELFDQASQRLYELEPSALAAFNMARRYMRRDNVENAKKYYQQAMEQETDQALLADYYYEYGVFIFVKENALQEARSYARKAIAINPNYCEAYMLIGNIYIAASQKFQGSDLEKSAVFWVACDYFDKARRYEDCSIEASEQLSKYRRYFPNKEEAFMEGLQAGANYKVGGWINESTKIRF